jgi:hypothetical protein
MNWKGCGRKRSRPDLRYYPSICLKGLGITTIYMSQDSGCKTRVWTPSGKRYDVFTVVRLKMETVCISETLASTDESTRRQNPEQTSSKVW